MMYSRFNPPLVILSLREVLSPPETAWAPVSPICVDRSLPAVDRFPRGRAVSEAILAVGRGSNETTKGASVVRR